MRKILALLIALPSLAFAAYPFEICTQNYVLASPATGSSAGPISCRALVTADVPTLNQTTTGSAAKWTTARNLAGNSVDGSGNVSFANKFIVQGTADSGLSAAQFLGALGTGIVKNTTTTGVLSIASGADLPAMSATVGGAVPTPPNNTTTFLRGDGTFATPGGGGTVTSASVVSANGFAGTVATASSTPAITLTTSITGVLKGNATAISAATAGTDYSAGTSALSTGILKSTTTTGALTIAVAGDFPTLNQSTTGSAATLTTTRSVYGTNFNGSADISGPITGTYGGTGVNNGSNTITLGGTLTTSGASALTITTTGTTNATLPAGTNNIGYLEIPQNSKSAAYTTVLADSGKHIYHPGADTTARTFTIDSNANVAYPIGTAITFINDTSAGVITIAITSDTMILAGAGTTGSRTLAASCIATAIKVTSTRWIISGPSCLT